jgi:UDP-glucose:glycoprotein glucosyltransferase
MKTQSPPRGLQFMLGSSRHPDMVDTITMANLGYLQLKSSPGIWNLKIRNGRSNDIYQLLETSRTPIHNSKIGTIVVNSLEDNTIYPMVSKKPGMESEDVLGQSDDKNEDSGLWARVKNTY